MNRPAEPVKNVAVWLVEADDRDFQDAMSRARDPWKYMISVREIEVTAHGVEVRWPQCPVCAVNAVAPQETERVFNRTLMRLTIPVVGWPGSAWASRLPAPGEEVQAFEGRVATMVDLHEDERPATGTATVRFRAVQPEAWGDAHVFDVALTGPMRTTCSRTAMSNPKLEDDSSSPCSQPPTEVRAHGELVVRASDGAFIALRLRGPVSEASQAGHVSVPTMGAATGGVFEFEAVWTTCEQAA